MIDFAGLSDPKVVRKPADPLILAAIKLGFKKDFTSKSGGTTLKVYTKSINRRRTVTLQFWGSGMNRASSEFLGCSDTAPTEFTDLDGLHDAVAHESVRLDSKYAQPGSTATEKAVRRG